MSEGWFVYAVLLKHYYYIMNVAGVNCRTSGMLKFDSFLNQTVIYKVSRIFI